MRKRLDVIGNYRSFEYFSYYLSIGFKDVDIKGYMTIQKVAKKDTLETNLSYFGFVCDLLEILL